MNTDIAQLVTRFGQHAEAYRSANYNETQLREDFLNPFFRSLGWDMDNSLGYAQAYRDVIQEESFRFAGSVKAPDFTFRIGGVRKFFVEAKRPGIDIKTAIQPAFQLRRYAWSAKLPLSILTDFEEFAVYDCRVRPEKDDNASKARVFYCRYEEYEKHWEWISSVFSHDAILKGSFDKYVESNKAKRGTAEVDDDFLRTIEGWRTELARNIALRNGELSERDLNFSVQRIIDRIIFLRICEDRGIENYGTLQKLASKPAIYEALSTRFLEADAKYNSGLFHFKKESGREELPDSLTPTLKVDDQILKNMLKELYYPESPYEFSVISADILGQVYEQFLGKVIRLTAGHRAVIEYKPEVRKAGGVYYTPTYIVEHIVRHTVGELTKGKTDKQVANLRFLDPACGSGSFLIAVFQHMLDWYLTFYTSQDPEKWTKGRRAVLVQVSGNQWRLTLDERKRILLTHIYGVDIDYQAVEVTKLSLLLKVLEGETEQTIQPYLSIFHERALPDLGNNIKCGNSLIGRDFYQNPHLPFDEIVPEKINVFDWSGSDGFPEIMGSGGFDAVVGNPPYIFVREQISSAESNYFSKAYALGWEKQNTFMLFMEKLLGLVKASGFGSFIVPNSWLTIESAKHLRAVYIDRLHRLIDMNYPAFAKVSMEPCIFVVTGRNLTDPVDVATVASRSEFQLQSIQKVDRARWRNNNGRISTKVADALTDTLDALRARVSTIEKSFDVRTGLQAYEKGKGNPPQTAADVKNHIYDADRKVDAKTFRYLEGRDVGRYRIGWSGMWMRYGEWLSQPRELSIFTRPRVLLREITSPFPYCLNACFSNEQFLNNKSILGVLHASNDEQLLKALACVLNSRLISAFYKAYAVKSARKIFPKVVIKNLREFPFPAQPEKQIVVQLAQLHDKISGIFASMGTGRSPTAAQAQLRYQSALEDRIDQLVYRIFGLSQSEAEIITAYTERA